MSSNTVDHTSIAVDALRFAFDLDFERRIPFLEDIFYLMIRSEEAKVLSLLSHGFVQVVLDMLFEVEFVGTTIAQLKSLRDGDESDALAEYRVWVIAQYRICLVGIKYLHDNGSEECHPAVAEAKDLALSKSTNFWASFYEIRHLLLSAEPRNSLFRGLFEEMLVEIAEITAALGKQLGTPAMGGPHALHMMLYLWIHAQNKRHRQRALVALHGCLGVGETIEGLTTWHNFYEGAITTVADSAQIAACQLRDIKDPSYVDHPLYAASVWIAYIHASTKHSQLNVPVDEHLLLHVLAAARRQLCLGHDNRDQSTKHIFTLTIMYVRDVMAFPSSENMTRVVELPEQYFHMMMALIALLFASRLKAGPQAERDLDARIFSLVKDVLDASATSFELISQRKPPGTRISRRLGAIRWLTFRLHSSATVAFDMKASAFRDSWVAECRKGWQDIGRFLPLDFGSFRETDQHLPMHKRCGYKGCLCNTFRPAHPLRVCQGCWSVAYCGPQCQKSAWKEGHKDQCSNHRCRDV